MANPAPSVAGTLERPYRAVMIHPMAIALQTTTPTIATINSVLLGLRK